MTLMDILFLIAVILGMILILLYFLNQWATKKYGAQQELIESSKITTDIFVLHKKKISKSSFKSNTKILFVYKNAGYKSKAWQSNRFAYMRQKNF